MTDRSPSLSTLEHTREELVRAQWTQWRSFLEAHIQLLDARAAAGQPHSPFEHDPESATVREEAARTQLAALDATRRAVFEQVYEQARQAAQAEAEQARAALPADARGKPLDPDTIDRQVLQGLLADAEGSGSRAPKGRVPIEPGTWWVVEAQTFLAAPKLDAYAIAGQRRRGSKMGALIGSAAMLGVGVIAVLAYFLWPTGTPAPTTAAQPVVAAGAPVERWPLRGLELSGTRISSTTIQLDPSHRGGCAGLPPDGMVAGVESGASLPLRLCVRGLDLAKVDTVALYAQGDLPVRRYRRTSVPVPDVELHAPDGVPWFGALLATEPIADYTLGDAVSLDAETTLRVMGMTAAGPAEDPALPADQMRVSVAVSATTAVDWAARAPTLLSARGDLVETSATEASTDGAELRYVVPLTTEPLVFVWRVSRADGSAVRWRATLPPPPDRSALLWSSISVSDAHASTAPDDPMTVQLALVVRNDGRVPLTLQAADLVVTRDGQPVPLGAVDGISEPLDPGGTGTLTSTISAPAGSRLILSLGAARRALSR
jgi:hypothetical protein